MRQAQQNRRGRGRNNNNRKSQNPLTRSFESNGPDVKIRGTPSHIAEKYVAMARDALSSGDPVLAENYLQHAEHYNRIIMTYREQQGPHAGEGGQPSQGVGHRQRNVSDQMDDDVSNDDLSDDNAPVVRGSEPQPSIASGDREQGDRPPRRHTAARDRSAPRDRDRESDGERSERSERSSGERQSGAGGRASGRGRRSRYAQSDDQPEFLKRPVRRPRASDDDEAGAPEPAVKSDQAAE